MKPPKHIFKKKLKPLIAKNQFNYRIYFIEIVLCNSIWFINVKKNLKYKYKRTASRNTHG